MSITNGLIYTSPSSQDPSGQPGFTGSGNIWVQTDTGNWYARNSTNTGWTIIGSGDQNSFGLFPLSGGAGSGAITGNTGLMTADGNTPFAVPPTVTNRSSIVATLSDLAALQTNLQTLIKETVAQSVSSIATPGINASISIKETAIGGALTASPAYNSIITLPYQGMTYADGTAVALSDCHGFASINTANANGIVGLFPQDNQGMSWQAYVAGANVAASINYLIIAIKLNA